MGCAIHDGTTDRGASTSLSIPEDSGHAMESCSRTRLMSSTALATFLQAPLAIGALLMATACGGPDLPADLPPDPPGVRFDGTRIDVDFRYPALGCSESPTELVEGLPRLEEVARPEWDESPPGDALEPREESGVVAIHLDISLPMAGFLPPPSRRDAVSTFHVVAQNVGQHMASVYGRSGGVIVGWRGIGHELIDLPRTLRIRRDLFNGRSTRLDLSIKSMLADFRSGRAEAAALVTDLMATGEGTGVTGPVTVANALGEWLQSEDVRSGDFHVGLLGVKAEYWGVTHPTECPPGPPLGCWFDETSAWIPAP